MSLTDSLIAEYYCKGIETALVSADEARAWADSAIAEAADPDYRFIEVSWSKTIPELLSALRAFVEPSAHQIVGRWLLAKLRLTDTHSTEALVAAVRKAMLVSRHCDMGDEVYYEFDSLDDSIFLARYEMYGTVADLRAEFLTCLQRHALSFPTGADA